MIIKALNTFGGILDLSALERLQESNPIEHYPFRLYIKPGESIEVDDKFYTLTRIQSALNAGYIEIGNVKVDPSLNKSLIDSSYSGTIMTQTAGENLIFGDVVYYNADGKVYKAKADLTSTMICMGISTEDVDANDSVSLLIDGLIRSSSRFGFTVGGQASSLTAIVYVSDITIGDVTQTRPTLSSHIVQIIGYALTTNVLSFKPDYTYIEIA